MRISWCRQCSSFVRRAPPRVSRRGSAGGCPHPALRLSPSPILRGSLICRRSSGMIPQLWRHAGGTPTALDASMSVVPTRRASELTGLSTSKLREWTSRRALIPADVPPKSQGSPAKYRWQTILLLRVAVILRDHFHLELHAYRHIFASLGQELQRTSFVTLWGQSLAIHDSGRWSLVESLDSAAPAGDVLLVHLDPHLQILSDSFTLPSRSTAIGQLDLFPATAVRRKAMVVKGADLATPRSVAETARRMSA